MKDNKLKFFGLKKLSPFLKPYRLLFVVMSVGVLIVGTIDILIPLFQRYAIDTFIAGRTLEGFAPFVALYVGVIVLSMALDYVASFNCCRIEMFILRDMRNAGFNHLQTLSVSYFNTNSVGTIHARLMSDTGNISTVMSWVIYQGVWHTAYVLGAVTVMLILNPLLALCVIVIVPVVSVVTAIFNRKLTKLNRKVREINASITAGFNEGITGVETGKTLAIEQKLEDEFSARTSEMRRQSKKLGRTRAIFVDIIIFASAAALALVLWYGGVITVEGVIMIGTLSVFMNYAQGLMEPVQWIVDSIADMITLKVNVERFTALLQTTTEVKDTPEVIEKYGDAFMEKRENWEKLEGEIEFDDVTFRYPDGGGNVLEHFNLKVKKGSNVAIVGETGAGKSTLVNLVCRFFEPTEGRVLIDGRDARERSVQWLHSNIGYVLQTPHLFSGTVRENLLYGKQNATDEELDKAIDSVNARKIIERLDNGYDSVIGEGGNTLSAGEKQLLSFARAILADPAIFILDEATASVDTITERLIQDAIQTLMRGRTCFMIAHRLSTVLSADVILVVDGGKIVERGTHEELLKARGRYFKLYMEQFREEQVKKAW